MPSGLNGPRVSRSDKPSSLSKLAHTTSRPWILQEGLSAHKRQASLPYGICAPFKKCHDLKGMFFFLLFCFFASTLFYQLFSHVFVLGDKGFGSLWWRLSWWKEMLEVFCFFLIFSPLSCFQEASRQSSSFLFFFFNTLQYYQLFCSCARNVGFCPHAHNCFCLFFFYDYFKCFVIQWKECKVIMYSYMCLETFATPRFNKLGQIKWDWKDGVSSRYCFSCAEVYIFEKTWHWRTSIFVFLCCCFFPLFLLSVSDFRNVT